MKYAVLRRFSFASRRTSLTKKWIFLLYVVGAISLAALVLARSGGPAQVASAAQLPNVVVIMADDLDLNMTETLLQGGYMPNLQTHIVDAGTTFENSFVTSAVCCPSRATFLTGQYSHNHQVLGNLLPDGGASRLDDTTTLATWLQDAGYVTGFVGKDLNQYGDNPNAPPDSALNPTYVPPGYDYWRGFLDLEMYNYDVNVNGTLKRYGNRTRDYQTDVIDDLATRFIRAADGQDNSPFLLILTPTAPHSESLDAVSLSGCGHPEWSRTIRPARRHAGDLASLPFPQPASFNEADLTDKVPFLQQSLPLMTQAMIDCAEEQYQNRAEAVLAIDDLVGSVVDELIHQQELDNTVLIFTSDNGFFHGEHRLFQKLIPYEEALRVPLYIRAPGYTAGQRVEQFALNNDLAPTIAELAGVTPGRAVDGRSLLAVMQNPSLQTWRQRFLIEFLGTVRVTVPHFTGIRTAQSDSTAPNQVYMSWEDGSLEYYDLAIDPDQMQSDHDNPSRSEELQALEGYLNNLLPCGNGSCQTFED